MQDIRFNHAKRALVASSEQQREDWLFGYDLGPSPTRLVADDQVGQKECSRQPQGGIAMAGPRQHI